ncbi:MAG: hypothetical protein LiPW30_292 [Parcubacteria group bacterium LiPW_30]|nr:MAG: hypothetical protein LiPW30_292 [Parcubacteria group bacterium LiPW_30]
MVKRSHKKPAPAGFINSKILVMKSTPHQTKNLARRLGFEKRK